MGKNAKSLRHLEKMKAKKAEKAARAARYTAEAGSGKSKSARLRASANKKLTLF